MEPDGPESAGPANRSAASKVQYFEEAGPLHLDEYLRIVELIDVLLSTVTRAAEIQIIESYAIYATPRSQILGGRDPHQPAYLGERLTGETSNFDPIGIGSETAGSPCRGRGPVRPHTSRAADTTRPALRQLQQASPTFQPGGGLPNDAPIFG
jgi:hypothetical protein